MAEKKDAARADKDAARRRSAHAEADRLDVTARGGRYDRGDGVLVDADGVPLKDAHKDEE